MFVLNTKNLTGQIKIIERAIYQNGHATKFVPGLFREIETVRSRLSRASGLPVSVWGLLVLAGDCELVEKGRPTDFTVLRARDLPAWFAKLPTERISAGDVLRLERAARDPQTWAASPRHRGSRPPEPRRGSTSEPARRGRSEGVTGHDLDTPRFAGITVNEWKRYGKHRLYANTIDGARLGYIDVPTGEIVLEVDDASGIIAAQLRASRGAGS